MNSLLVLFNYRLDECSMVCSWGSLGLNSKAESHAALESPKGSWGRGR